MNEIICIIEDYINFLNNQLQQDIQVFDHWSMWLIIPLIFAFLIHLLKYTILLSPILLPIGGGIGALRSLFTFTINKKNK